jgi:hypothetical protein
MLLAVTTDEEPNNTRVLCAGIVEVNSTILSYAPRGLGNCLMSFRHRSLS